MKSARSVTCSAGCNKLPAHVFICLLIVLVLVFLLLQLRHRRKIALQISTGIAEARDILNASAEGVVTTNSSGKITGFNRSAETMFGYMADTVLGKNFLILFPEDCHQANQHIMSGPGSNAVASRFELTGLRADGLRFPLILTVKPIREHGKNLFVGTFLDITDRKRAEENHWRSQHFMEFLLQTSSIVFYTCKVKQHTRICYVSPNVEQLLGYEPETITGATAFWSRYVHPDEQELFRSYCLSGLTAKRENLEYRLKFADGHYRWVADSRILIRDEDGEPGLLIGCWTDIHERKKAEVDLASREERLRIRLKCARLASWDWVINTGEITWSGPVHETFGLDHEQAMNFDDLTAIAHPKDRESLQSAFRDCLVKNEVLDYEFRIVWPDKSVHWIHLVGELINDRSGGPVGMAGVLFDKTTQKQLRVAPDNRVKRAS